MRLLIDSSRHLKLKENLLWLGTTTLVTVLIWIFYTIYVAYNKPEIDPKVQALLTPLDPKLDSAAIALMGEPVNPPEAFSPVILEPVPFQNTAVNVKIPLATASARVTPQP